MTDAKNDGDGALRNDIKRRVAELRDQSLTCESAAIRIFAEQFDLLSEASLREATAHRKQTPSRQRCACQPLHIATLCLGILGSRAASSAPGEPIRALNILGDRFRDTHCPACHAENRVDGPSVVPLIANCTDALVNGVMWVRELATERDWI